MHSVISVTSHAVAEASVAAAVAVRCSSYYVAARGLVKGVGDMSIIIGLVDEDVIILAD